jgi:adhesin transport system membrane fusion protein
MNNSVDDAPKSGRGMILGSMLALTGLVIWAAWAEIDQITRATGQVIVSSRNQMVQSADGGVVTEILVREGAVVKKGQLLMRFDQIKAESAYLETRAKLMALKAATARLHAEIFGEQPRFPKELDERKYADLRANQLNLYRKRHTALSDELSALERMQALIRTELEMNVPLLKSGDVSRADVLKLERQMAEIQAQIVNRRNKFLQDAQAELAKTQEELSSVEQMLTQRKDMLDRTDVFAPMDGVVRNVRITTIGGVARAGEELMQIVPVEDDLLIEAKVTPKDIAFIRLDLPAVVKLDAYDYTLYGSLDGRVSYVSADTMTEESSRTNEQPYYRVQIKTDGRNFIGRNDKKIEIQPGMTASVEIKTGRNTVLRYLTKPVTKTIAESMGER